MSASNPKSQKYLIHIWVTYLKSLSKWKVELRQKEMVKAQKLQQQKAENFCLNFWAEELSLCKLFTFRLMFLPQRFRCCSL